ncbi:unnamed protein product [Candidula unifasciata]|uniref:Uncharacterized protein n=1 Tax=Candidula unifasciata TaxID=100452 RepID=A0A8S3YN40_9EUPU|nr:unnamed protein product [Candidula unifasciata]
MADRDEELFRAVQGNHVKQVETLLDHGVSLNVSDTAPMKLAIETGNTKLAILLLERRSSMSISNRYELLEHAMIKKQSAVVARLLKHKVSPNAHLSFGDSPLCFAAEVNSQELVKVLLQANANPNSVNAREETALYIACRDGSTAIAKILITFGADLSWVHTKDYNFTPLIVAVANDNRDIVQLLLNFNINIDAQDTEGWTALWHAYSNGNEEICALLLKAGAKTDIPNNEGKTVIQEANEDEDEENFTHLFTKYAKFRNSLTL